MPVKINFGGQHWKVTNQFLAGDEWSKYHLGCLKRQYYFYISHEHFAVMYYTTTGYVLMCSVDYAPCIAKEEGCWAKEEGYEN